MLKAIKCLAISNAEIKRKKADSVQTGTHWPRSTPPTNPVWSMLELPSRKEPTVGAKMRSRGFPAPGQYVPNPNVQRRIITRRWRTR